MNLADLVVFIDGCYKYINHIAGKFGGGKLGRGKLSEGKCGEFLRPCFAKLKASKLVLTINNLWVIY